MDKLTYSVSMERTVGLPNYCSAKVRVSLDGVHKGMSESEMDELIELEGALAYKKVRAALARKVAEIDDEAWERLKAARDTAPEPRIPVGGR